jgi:hypothetical protein
MPPASPEEKTPDIYCTGGWVGLRAGVELIEKRQIFSPCREWNPDFSVTDWTTLPQVGEYKSYKRNTALG